MKKKIKLKTNIKKEKEESKKRRKDGKEKEGIGNDQIGFLPWTGGLVACTHKVRSVLSVVSFGLAGVCPSTVLVL